LLFLVGDFVGDFPSSLNVPFVPAFSVSSESVPLSSLFFLSLLLDLRFLNESAPTNTEISKFNQRFNLTYLSALDFIFIFYQVDLLFLKKPSEVYPNHYPLFTNVV